jgi:hypothetical protein
LKLCGKTLHDLGICNDFLNSIQTDQEIRARIDKCDCVKLKRFCTAKETISRVKIHTREWEKKNARY